MTSEPRYRAMNGKEIKEYLEIEQWKGEELSLSLKQILQKSSM